MCSAGLSLPSQTVSGRSSLLDIAPTLLAFLHLAPMKDIDGVSLLQAPLAKKTSGFSMGTPVSRPLYLETGYSLANIETDKISINKVLKKSLSAYQLNPENAYLSIRAGAERSVIKGKQRALLMGDWLLARYPASYRKKIFSKKTFSLPAHYVLANIKTGQWSIGFDSSLAKAAPLKQLRKKFEAFYGDELL